MIFRGRAWKFGDDIDTDIIIPARYLSLIDAQELGRHCMEGLDPDFPRKISKGDIIVGGKNFGCGSSREHASVAIKSCGISCVIAKSFARIFYRNSFNTGLPITECSELADSIKGGEELEVDTNTGVIKDLTNGRTFNAMPIPPFMQEILSDGGLIPHILKEKKGVK